MVQAVMVIRALLATIVVLVALLTAVLAGWLTQLDGAALPGVVMRSGIAFGAALGIGVAVLALLW
ncbi:putative membrane protein [Actinoplanes octamycinicus]|uniref:Putative membrane protein n=1 Tax=Actinoplanes octamycinicus TaxID=135948 RepID=A0A7W7M8R6_9ACTN|nr:hypothetical protein [Actinoplanes octamycinicus]MBB4741197.1 putative membrane protein [Actinoplanes octamycinicus]GIE56103.1 hypothetical protein Aoc01nite_15050 [Actinoplanes octamycinicus]